MTANHEHTPTTQYLQNAYVDTRYNLAAEQGEFPPPIMERYAEFDRWYQAEIAAAEQRGAIKALRDAAQSPRLADAVQYAIKHHKYASAARRSFENYLLQEANRADRLEGDVD